jgi:hypothetical protein
MSEPSGSCGTRAKDFRITQEAAAIEAAASFFVWRGFHGAVTLAFLKLKRPCRKPRKVLKSFAVCVEIFNRR